MRSATALGAVVAAGLLVASCAGGAVGSGDAGTATATPASSTSPTTAPPTATSGSASTPTPPPPPLRPATGVGAYGYISAGPTCPVERPGHPCPPRPVSNGVTAVTAGCATVASTHSDSSGRCAVELSPGRFTLVVTTPTGWPRCPPTAVTVKAGSATRADISCDTGIR